MTQKNDILQELNDLKSMLVNVPSDKTYSVPVDYFDALSSQILNRIKAMEAATVHEELNYLSPTLNGYSKQIPYEIPAGYFEGLAERTLQLIQKSSDYQTVTEELNALSPLLSGLKKDMPYQVPQGYFEKLAETNTKPQTKVIAITYNSWFRYAAAAVVTGVIALTSLFVFNRPINQVDGGKALSKLTKDVIKMNDSEKTVLVDEYIDGGFNQVIAKAVPEKSDDVKILLQGIPDQELKDFEEQTEDIQDVLMTN